MIRLKSVVPVEAMICSNALSRSTTTNSTIGKLVMDLETSSLHVTTPNDLNPFQRTNSESAPAVNESHQVAAVKYARLVRDFANLPDGRGANHALLASFLGKLSSRWPAAKNVPQLEEHFAVAYTFHNDEDDANSKKSQGQAKYILNDFVDYRSCFDFVSRTSSEASKSPGRLLFLGGFPSAEWLSLIGARYRVDPEFYMRFLHFKPPRDTAINYSLPALPAATWNIFELPIITIGERRVLTGLIDQAEIDRMRREAKEKLQGHHDFLRGHENIAVASAVVRDVAIIDHSCFALEQRIWICLQPYQPRDSNSTRWTLVVWTDASRTPSVKSILDLGVLPTAFQNEGTSLVPVIDYKPGTGLAAEKFKTTHDRMHSVKGAEAASQLCIGYGQTLYEEVMARDPLYALTEVFNLATASVNQYLNVIEHKLIGFTSEEHYDNFDMLSNLRYSKDILYRQQRQLEQVNAWLVLHKLRGGTGWRTTNDEDARASQAADCVVQRYEYLQTRVKTLQAQCQDAISNLMNSINLKEVKSSYDQSKRIAKLTFLAFVFAPLSFTTSFFAMNIGLEHLSLTSWIISTISLLSITFFIVVFDIIDWVKRLRNQLLDLKNKARYL